VIEGSKYQKLTSFGEEEGDLEGGVLCGKRVDVFSAALFPPSQGDLSLDHNFRESEPRLSVLPGNGPGKKRGSLVEVC